MSVSILKLEFKIPEGRTYLSFNFPIGPNIGKEDMGCPTLFKEWVSESESIYTLQLPGFWLDISSQSNEEGFSNIRPQISKL